MGDATTRRHERHAPYIGLAPYAEEDADIFFGRESECEIIAANLMASRLTLLYGPSGVGKTSALHAGVIRRLQSHATDYAEITGRADAAVVVFDAWHDDPVPRFLERAEEAVHGATGATVPRSPRSHGLAGRLRTMAAPLDGGLFVILDQFEEYFVYHDHDHGAGSWTTEFAHALMQPDLRVNFLISIRDDALSRLDRFKGQVANLFENYLRIEHLTIEAAREAIERPLQVFNEIRPGADSQITIEPELVEVVIDQVRTGKVASAHGGLGVVTEEGASMNGRNHVEAPYLQLVMNRLWNEELAHGSSTLRLETLQRLGGSERIVRTHLDKALAALEPEHQAVAATAFRYLVTPSGTKITHSVSDLAAYAGLREDELGKVLAALVAPRVRILRPVAPPLNRPMLQRYEIFHDVLAASILDWRTRHERAVAAQQLERDKTEAEEEARRERRRARKFRALALALVALVLVTAALSVVAIVQRRIADHAAAHALTQSRVAKAAALRAKAAALIPTDPQLGIVSAIEAYEIAPSSDAEHQLRDVLSNLGAGGTGPVETVPAAAFSPDGRRVVTVGRGGKAEMWNPHTGEPIRTIDAGNRVTAIAFSPDGTQFATSDLAGYARTWNTNTGRRRHTFSAHASLRGPLLSVAYSKSSSELVTVGVKDNGTIWNIHTGAAGTLNAFKPPTFAASFGLGGHVVALVGAGGVAGIASSKSPLKSTTFSGRPYLAVVSPRGDSVITADSSRLATCRLGFQKGSGVPVSRCRPLRGHAGPVTAAVFSPNGKEVMTSSIDGAARVWRTRSGVLPRVLPTHGGPVLDARFDSTGKLAVTAGADGTVRIWKVSTGEEIRAIRVSSGTPVLSAAFSPDDGSVILTVTANGATKLWNWKTQKVNRSLGGT